MKKTQFLRLLLVFFYMLALFIASSIEKPPSVVSQNDKFMHVLAYFILGLLLINFWHSYFNSYFRRHKFKVGLVSLFSGIFYALSDELHQYYVPGRYASWADIGADSLGIVLALILYVFFLAKQTATSLLNKPSQ